MRHEKNLLSLTNIAGNIYNGLVADTWNSGVNTVQSLRKGVDSRWIYSLPARIENYPLIDLAQRKFAKEIKPDKCYFFQRFYYDSSGMQQHIDQYIIYFKDNKPFTTEPAIGFAQKPDGSYELQETIKGQSSAVITAKNNSIKLITPDNCQPTGKTNENHYCTNGQNIVTLKPTNLFNGLNIRSAYWIYRFL